MKFLKELGAVFLFGGFMCSYAMAQAPSRPPVVLPTQPIIRHTAPMRQHVLAKPNKPTPQKAQPAPQVALGYCPLAVVDANGTVIKESDLFTGPRLDVTEINPDGTTHLAFKYTCDDFHLIKQTPPPKPATKK